MNDDTLKKAVAGMTREQLRWSLAQARDSWFADLLAVWIGLAAETHPEEIRKALSKAFDLSVIEETHKRLLNIYCTTQQSIVSARELAQAIINDLDAIEARIDALNMDLAKIEEKVA